MALGVNLTLLNIEKFLVRMFDIVENYLVLLPVKSSFQHGEVVHQISIKKVCFLKLSKSEKLLKHLSTREVVYKLKFIKL